MKKDRASAIIPYNGGIICIQRIKGKEDSKEEYYTIPGGGREEGESIKEATLREIREELGIEIELTNRCYELESQDRKQYFFIAKYKSGKVGTGKGEEMTNINYERYGAYIPKIVAKKDIKNINLLPNEIKNIILKDLDLIFEI